MTNSTETSHSESLMELFSALAKAQGKIENAIKDKKNPFFKSTYADLSSVWDVCREPLSANGLSIIQTVEGSKTDSFLVTWLGHASGQWMKSRMPLMMKDKPDAQSMGSAITYARRYALSAMVGVCADVDDDGEKAVNRRSAREENEKVECIHDKVEKQKENEFLINEFIMEFEDKHWEKMKSYILSHAKHYYKEDVSKSLSDFKDKKKFFEDVIAWTPRKANNA